MCADQLARFAIGNEFDQTARIARSKRARNIVEC